MNLTEFRAVMRDRIPSAEEFIAATEGQGWRISLRSEGKAMLRVPDATDPLAVAFARMLGREPYRTNVLKAAQAQEEKGLSEAWSLLGRMRGAPYYADVQWDGQRIVLVGAKIPLSEEDRAEKARLKRPLKVLVQEAQAALAIIEKTCW